MISSIEQITLKDGQTILVMSHADLVETMRNTLGDEFADLVAQEMTGTDRAHASEIQGYEASIQEKEMIVDSYSAALRDVLEEARQLQSQLAAPRLNRENLKKTCTSIIDIVEEEI